MIHLRPRWLVLAAIALAAILALAVAATRGLAVRAYALDVPDLTPVARLGPGQRGCEGPISSRHPFRAVRLWVASSEGAATAVVTVRSASTHRELESSRPIALGPLETESAVRLPHPVDAEVPVSVCLEERTGTVSAWGSQATTPGVAASGTTPGTQFSLVLLTDAGDGSLLHWLPVAFARASLWRPSWVGSWTFWVLAIAMLAMFGVGVSAVLRAASEDEGIPVAPDGDSPSDDGGAPPRSEARENSPEPVS